MRTPQPADRSASSTPPAASPTTPAPTRLTSAAAKKLSKSKHPSTSSHPPTRSFPGPTRSRSRTSRAGLEPRTHHLEHNMIVVRDLLFGCGPLFFGLAEYGLHIRRQRSHQLLEQFGLVR